MFDPISIGDLGELDCLPNTPNLSPIIAAAIHEQTELGTTHAKGIHFAIMLSIHLDVSLKVAIRALSTEPEALPQKLCLNSVIARRGAQANAKHLLHSRPPD